MVSSNTGFKMPTNTALLVFDDTTGFGGSEIRINIDVKMRVYLKLIELMNKDDMGRNPGPLFKMFAEEVLLEWNLRDDDGNLVPCNYRGMLDGVTVQFAQKMIQEWFAYANRLPGPLEQSSPNGNSLAPEQSLPTAEPLPNQPSLSEQN